MPRREIARKCAHPFFPDPVFPMWQEKWFIEAAERHKKTISWSPLKEVTPNEAAALLAGPM